MRLALATALALVLAASAGAAPPQRGLVVPGIGFGGLHLGMTTAQVAKAWGSNHGVCRGCPTLTWYYTYAKFKPQGAAVVFRRGRVDSLYTLWQPAGWRTSQGLRIGDDQARITEVYGVLVPTSCPGYSALTLLRHGALTSFYVVDGKVWGLGLSRAAVPACR